MMKTRRIIMSLLATATAFAVQAQTTPIPFEDQEVKRICVENWDTNGDGELSYDEAAAVTDLGENAFMYNKNIVAFDELKYFTGVTRLRDNTFCLCENLKKISFPPELHFVGFQVCFSTKLTNVELPLNLDTIRARAFSYCQLEKVRIPASVRKIESEAFCVNNNLSEIIVEEGNQYYESPNNCNAIIEKSSHTLIAGCDNTVIPEGVERIGMSAFEDCLFETIAIPSSLKAIEGRAFLGCSNLSHIELPEGLQSIGFWAFYMSPKLTSLHIPSTVTEIEYGISATIPHAKNPDVLTSIVVADGNSHYDSRDNCNAIIETATNTLVAGCATTVIPASVNHVGRWAMANRGMLVNVIPNHVTTIDYMAYAQNHACKKIVLHAGITSIDEYAFANNEQLDSCVCYMTTPLPINANTFLGASNSTWGPATLYVPVGTKALYEQAEGWKEFPQIVEMTEPAETVELVEYFYDTDPGHGKGTIINNVKEGDNTLQLSTNGLQPGPHLLFMRSQSSSGAWSTTQAHAFYLGSKRGEQVARLEYFFDQDPGYGKGKLISNVGIGEQKLQLSTEGLPTGAHLLFVRSLDDQGHWSSLLAHPFMVCNSEGFAALEYFIDDNDPGVGNATQLEMPVDGMLTFSIPTDELAAGEHTIYVRGINADGIWSQIQQANFMVTLPELAPCADVTYTYNGRYATLSTTTDEAKIYYTLDGSDPTENSSVYTGTIDVGGLTTLKAVATKEGMNPSDTLTYNVPCYYEGTTAQVGVAGAMSLCFGWCDAQQIEQIIITGHLNDDDFATLRSLNALRHANLKQADMVNGSLPDNAFAGMGIISIELSTAVESVGNSLFANCMQLAAIGWNANTAIANQALADINNPNLLLYADSEGLVQSAGVTNVVVGSTANTIRLSDSEGNANFYAMRPFTAQDISYTHRYTMKSGYDNCSGWETIALPFDVQTITHENQGVLTPFASGTGSYNERPFWLCELASTGWQETAQVKANTPYLIAMPNNEAYSEQYLLAGNVTFASTQVQVPVSEAHPAISGQTQFVPTTIAIEAAESVFALNLSSYDQYSEGSVFVAGLRQVRPFEAYRTTTTQSGARYMPISDDMMSGITHIQFNRIDNADIYDLQGRKVRRAGDSNSRLRPGIYIQNGRKIYVK